MHWTKTGVNTFGQTGVYHGITEFTKTSLGEGFISFGNLNKQIVFSWIMASLTQADLSSIDNAIDFDIYQKTYSPQEVTPAWLSDPLNQG